MREMEKIMLRIKSQIEKLEAQNNPDSSEQSGYDNSHSDSETFNKIISDNSHNLNAFEKPFAYQIAQKFFLGSSEHNIYNETRKPAHSKTFEPPKPAKLPSSEHLKPSEQGESKRSVPFHSHPDVDRKEETHDLYMGLRLFVHTNEWCLIAQGWGIYPQVLYKWCRHKGSQRIIAAIQYVHQIGDGYFNRPNVPLHTQRGKYLTHIVHSTKGGKFNEDTGT